MIVDDNAINRDVFASQLSPFEFTLLQACNGHEAVTIAKQQQPDLIIMDMKMPVMDGYEACKVLKNDENPRSIPIISATASALKEDEKRIHAIADDYLRKPVLKADLYQAIHRFLGSTIRENKPSRKVESVLIVDDNKINCLVLQGTLQQKKGLMLSEVHSGKEAITFACSNHHPDHNFMGFHMPDIDGAEASRVIKQWAKENNATHAHICAVSAMTKEDLLELDVLKDFGSFLSKPYSIADVFSILEHEF